MKNLLLCTVSLLALFLSGQDALAQLYKVDDLLRDSAEVHKAVKADTLYKEGSETYMIANGETVRLVGETDGYHVAVEYNGETYIISPDDLKFSKKNDRNTADPITTGSLRARHSALGHFYYSAFPYWLSFLVLIAIFAAMYLIDKKVSAPAVKQKLMLAVPAALLFVSILEIVGYCILGSDLLWWCDYDRNGFFKSLLMVIPFALAIGIQLYVGFMYKESIEDSTGKELSMKTVLLGLAATLVLPIVVIVILALCGINGTPLDITFAVLFLGSLALSVGTSLSKNIKALGRSYGTLFTAFTVVYAIGAIIAVILLITAILKLIFVILTAVAVVFGTLFILGSAKGSGSANKVIYYDKLGRQYKFDSDAQEANRKIDERSESGL